MAIKPLFQATKRRIHFIVVHLSVDCLKKGVYWPAFARTHDADASLQVVTVSPVCRALNPFTPGAPSCKLPGLKSACTRLQNSKFSGLITNRLLILCVILILKK